MEYFGNEHTNPQELECNECEYARLTALNANLSQEAASEIDALIYERRILEGMKKIREVLSIRLGQSNLVYSMRYKALRASNPVRFVCSEETYWNGFYS